MFKQRAGAAECGGSQRAGDRFQWPNITYYLQREHRKVSHAINKMTPQVSLGLTNKPQLGQRPCQVAGGPEYVAESDRSHPAERSEATCGQYSTKTQDFLCKDQKLLGPSDSPNSQQEPQDLRTQKQCRTCRSNICFLSYRDACSP